MKRYVLLDRDGTIIVDKHYLDDPDQIEFLPQAIEGLKRMQEAGFGLVIVTNQSGIGRGYFTPQRLNEIHHRLTQKLQQHDINLDGIYTCPHTPDCTVCRKPATGLAEQAAKDLGFTLEEAVVIGDKPSDVELGRRLGALSILIAPDATPDLLAAADLVIASLADGEEVHRPQIEGAADRKLP